jgi:hypothetical protein
MVINSKLLNRKCLAFFLPPTEKFFQRNYGIWNGSFLQYYMPLYTRFKALSEDVVECGSVSNHGLYNTDLGQWSVNECMREKILALWEKPRWDQLAEVRSLDLLSSKRDFDRSKGTTRIRSLIRFYRPPKLRHRRMQCWPI